MMQGLAFYYSHGLRSMRVDRITVFAGKLLSPTKNLVGVSNVMSLAVSTLRDCIVSMLTLLIDLIVKSEPTTKLVLPQLCK